MPQSLLKMLHPLIDNRVKMYQYVGLWISFAFFQAFVFNWITPIPFVDLLADGFTHAVLFGILMILLWSVANYGNFQALTVFQRLINYLALGVLSISIWLSLGYGTFALFWDERTVSAMIPLLPVRGFIGLLIYHIIIQQFMSQMQNLPKQVDMVELVDEPAILLEQNQSEPNVAIELLERIAVKSGTKIHVVMVPEIMFLQADGDYVQIYTANGKYLKEQTMKFFEEHLPEKQFVRVHRSYIVNVEMISRIDLYEKQSQQLTLKNGQQIKTSPNGYKSLRAALNL